MLINTFNKLHSNNVHFTQFVSILSWHICQVQFLASRIASMLCGSLNMPSNVCSAGPISEFLLNPDFTVISCWAIYTHYTDVWVLAWFNFADFWHLSTWVWTRPSSSLVNIGYVNQSSLDYNFILFENLDFNYEVKCHKQNTPQKLYLWSNTINNSYIVQIPCEFCEGTFNWLGLGSYSKINANAQYCICRML